VGFLNEKKLVENSIKKEKQKKGNNIFLTELHLIR